MNVEIKFTILVSVLALWISRAPKKRKLNSLRTRHGPFGSQIGPNFYTHWGCWEYLLMCVHTATVPRLRVPSSIPAN